MSKRTEKEIGTGNEDFLDKREIIGGVMEASVVRTVLRENGVTWLVNPSEGRMLDIAFVPKRGRRGDFAGVELFQVDDCIGVVLCDDKGRSATWEMIKRDRQLGVLVQNEAKVAVMTPDEFCLGVSFIIRLRKREFLLMWVVGQ